MFSLNTERQSFALKLTPNSNLELPINLTRKMHGFGLYPEPR